MGKEEIFSKLNIKDYNNILEGILEKKNFSEGTKNILLNILYKMENAYQDYNKVKIDTKTKKELLEEIINIIEDDCEQIDLVKPKIDEETILGKKLFSIDKETKKIVSYPNERFVCYALFDLQENKFKLDYKYDFLKEPIEELFSKGYKLDRKEIIRDFDGWSWNIVSTEIENCVYNLIYQNIKIILGSEFLKTCIGKLDFINKIENKLAEISDVNIIEKIYIIAVLEYIKTSKNITKAYKKQKDKLIKKLEELNNKKEYLDNLAKQKKQIEKEIKKIDTLLTDNKLLREKFINRNRELKDEEKVFSLSEYTDILHRRREEYLAKLKELSMLMKPMNYVKNKSELKKKVNILNQINFDGDLELQEKLLLLNIQKDFLKILDEKIKNAANKKEILDYIFVFRYYKLINVTRAKKIKDLKEIEKIVKTVEKDLITKACKLKAITIICPDIQRNFEILSDIFSMQIIDLDDILLEIKEENDKTIINVYDDNMIEDTKEYKLIEELNIKKNKKIKLFI